MQAVILAAGESSRFYPLNTKHKSLLSLLGEPIIVRTVRSIKRAGISDIIIVKSGKDDFEEVLGNGKRYGVKIQYVVQKEAKGAGDAVLAASKFIKDDFFVANAARVEFAELKQDLDKKRITNKFAILLAEKTENLLQYGAIIAEGDQVLEIIEKPTVGHAPSNLKVIGLYYLPKEFLSVLKRVGKGHYNFEDALTEYAKMGNVKYALTESATVTLKYPWDALKIKDFLLKSVRRSISKAATISKSAQLDGDVVIEEGATISDNAVVKGPAYIGKNAYVGTNSLIRSGTVIEENSIIGANAEVKNVLMLSNSKMHSGLIEDSIIGENVRIGAEIVTANTRIDRQNVEVVVKNEKVNSGLKNLGAIIGSFSTFGARVVTMPGVIIGRNVTIGPSTTVMKNIEDNITFYTEFKEFIEKKKSARKK